MSVPTHLNLSTPGEKDWPNAAIMKSFFGQQYSQEDLQSMLAQRRVRNVSSQAQSMAMMPAALSRQLHDGTSSMNGMAGESLDDMIMQNNQEIQRRQSMSQGYPSQDIDRRASMMEFGSNMGDLNGFQFVSPTTSLANANNNRRQSDGELDLDAYSGMVQAMDMGSQQMNFSLAQANSMNMNTNSQFSTMSGNMMQNMMNYGPMIEDITNGDPTMNTNMNMFSPGTYTNPYGGGQLDAMHNDFMMHPTDGLPRSLNGIRVTEERNDDMMPGLNVPHSPTVNTNSPQDINPSMGSFNATTTSKSIIPHATRESSYTLAAPSPASPTIDAPKPEPKPQYQGIYSSSGFDMLGALMKVATRKDPEIDIGKVDMSCAFVVCDVTLYDCPIIYVSDIFERLTGYNKHEVIGQNCRFLQSPDGKIEAGSKRDFVDNDSVYYLKNRIAAKKEAQRSVINYRKGGQPFMNLLTMIPITGEDDLEIRYIVGFQVDLVEKPGAVEGNNIHGLYTVDYSQGMLPRYVWQPPEGVRTPLDGGQSISRDDVSTILGSINTSTESELTKRMWDKVLLENTDDVVHVLSLKGLFLYLSPSSLKILEYDPSELVGTALSSVCHPSDIVPVTRELKDTSAGAVVNVVFRIRRKKSGYTWFESHGSLCVEQGKGRKCIILVGRERPVYAIRRRDIEDAGGLGEGEMWTKLSTSGMFLFVSSHVHVLDYTPDELQGTSMQALMREESRKSFGRCLEKARTGQRVTHLHEILNKRGLVMQAQTTLFPGDAAEGQKPTFLIAQTRLLKANHRPMATPSSLTTVQGSKGRIENTPGDSTPLSHPSGLTALFPTSGQDSSSGQIGIVSQAGGSGLVIGSQDAVLAAEDNIFDELKTTRCTSWQFELRQMEKKNRLLHEELASLISSKKKRKRRKGTGQAQRDCVNCHTRSTPEWRRGPSGNRDLCNSCGLRWAKSMGRVSPRNSNRGGDGSKASQNSNSPTHKISPEVITTKSTSNTPNLNTIKEMQGNVKGERAAVPAVLGGRTTIDSMPVHVPSLGFRDGGEHGLTEIVEGDEGIV